MVLLDGAHHEVDSSEWAFYQAVQFAMSDCFEDGVWQVLEPIMTVEATAPAEFQVCCIWHMNSIIVVLIMDLHFTRQLRGSS